MSKLSAPITKTILVVERQSFAGINRIQLQDAGKDIGAHEIWVWIPGESDTQILRLFGTYTADLYAIGDWLSEHGVRTVAMESTGVYWIPIFEYLKLQGFQCCLISSHTIKRVPGRKTDILDCQWIQVIGFVGKWMGKVGPIPVLSAGMLARVVLALAMAAIGWALGGASGAIVLPLLVWVALRLVNSFTEMGNPVIAAPHRLWLAAD